MMDKELSHKSYLKKEAKFNFQTFYSLEMNHENLEYLQLISSSVVSGCFKRISFYNASFFSTKFSDVIFATCNLQKTDICSVWARACEFRNVDFSEATISDSTFVDCTFTSSIFNGIAMTKCQFINCTFDSFPMEDSTFTLNIFDNCHIHKTIFTDSFYYQIFINDCTFHEVNMPSELLGYNFGFSSEVFYQLAAETDLMNLNQSFISNGLFINAAILGINQEQDYYDRAMIACVAALGKMIQNDILIKADEVEFLKNLTVHLYKNKQIAPLTILKIWQLLDTYLANDLSNVAADKAMPHIREYANTLYFHFIEFESYLQSILKQLPQDNTASASAELEIVYCKKPELPLIDYLKEFSNLVTPNCPKPELLRTATGSFHEWHEIAIIIIPYLQTFLSLLNILVTVAVSQKQESNDKHKMQQSTEVSNLSNKKQEIEITITDNKVNLSPILLPSPVTVNPSTSIIISDVVKVLEQYPLTKQENYYGYNSNNVLSITIRYK